jgi:frataxin-like iron-binding protein CyaY
VQNAEIKKIVIHSKAAAFEEMWISIHSSGTAAFLFAKSGWNHLVFSAPGSFSRPFSQGLTW